MALWKHRLVALAFAALAFAAAPVAAQQVVGGAVTTAAPTYVTGTSRALSLDTSGNLRVAGSFSASITLGACAVTATDICKNEDAVAASGDTGIAAWGVATNGTTALAAAGDYIANGRDTAGNARNVGNVASGAADAGDPLKIGCKYNVTPPTFADGNRADCQSDVNGNQKVSGTVAAAQSGTWTSTVTQATATNLNATVVQPTGSLLNATVVQATAANLNANVSQATAGNLNATVVGTGTFAVQAAIPPTATSGNAIAPSATAAVGSNQVLKASAGNVYGFQVTAGATAGLVYLFDATAAPADGAVAPKKCYTLGANATVAAEFNMPISMAAGATVVFGTGTNCFSLTKSATAFISGEAK